MTYSKSIIADDSNRPTDRVQPALGARQLTYSDGVRLDFSEFSWIMLSGVVALDENLEIVGEGDIRAQTRYVLNSIQRLLAREGASIDDICRVRVYVAGGLDREKFRIIHEERARVFDPGHYPASTLVEVSSLIRPELLIEIDADAVVGRSDASIRATSE